MGIPPPPYSTSSPSFMNPNFFLQSFILEIIFLDHHEKLSYYKTGLPKALRLARGVFHLSYIYLNLHPPFHPLNPSFLPPKPSQKPSCSNTGHL